MDEQVLGDQILTNVIGLDRISPDLPVLAQFSNKLNEKELSRDAVWS